MYIAKNLASYIRLRPGFANGNGAKQSAGRASSDVTQCRDADTLPVPKGSMIIAGRPDWRVPPNAPASQRAGRYFSRKYRIWRHLGLSLG